MKVWVMNLKDNREAPPTLEKSKFAFCRENGIVGIGWAGEDPADTENTAYLQAHTALFSFAPGDLVWVHDAGNGIYCLCKITAPAAPTSDDTFHRYDIGEFCRCVFFEVGDAAALPTGITPQALVSRRTVSATNETVSAITQQFPAKWDTKANAPSEKSEEEEKKNKTPLFSMKAIALACVCCILSSLLTIGVVHKRNEEYVQTLREVLEEAYDYADTVEKGAGLLYGVIRDAARGTYSDDTRKYIVSGINSIRNSIAALEKDTDATGYITAKNFWSLPAERLRSEIENPPRAYQEEAKAVSIYINYISILSIGVSNQFYYIDGTPSYDILQLYRDRVNDMHEAYQKAVKCLNAMDEK